MSRKHSLRSHEGGFVLPAVLFLVLALSAATFSLLLLARGEALLGRSEIRYLEDRVLAERWLAEGPVAPGGGGEGFDGAEERVLDAGYVLRSAPHGAWGPARFAVTWRPSADALGTLLPGALEVGADPDSDRVAALGESCPSGSPVPPLVRVRPDDPGDGVEADPPISAPPRIGPMGIEGLLDGAPLLVPGDALPVGAGPILGVPPGATIRGGEATAVLAASGDVRLEGGSVLRGLALIRGDLVLAEDARVEGVVLVGGRARMEGESRILGCPALAIEALLHAIGTAGFPVSGGSRLGRF